MESDEGQARIEPGGIKVAPGIAVPADTLRFSCIQSSGPGGQNVNKRATKAELRLWIKDLPLADDVRDRLSKLAGRRLTDEGELLITSEEHRSQSRNKAECINRLRELIVQAQVRPRRRRPARPSRGAVERRLAEKRKRAERKQSRRNSGEDCA